MNRIINGKRYDTSTAKRLTYWDNECYTTDFDYCSEVLYRKKTGEFFIFGTGGAASCYATRCEGNSWGGDSCIKPISLKEAQMWAEENLDGDEYEEIFGEVSEDDSKQLLYLNISPSVIKIINQEACKSQLTQDEYVELAIHELVGKGDA